MSNDSSDNEGKDAVENDKYDHGNGSAKENSATGEGEIKKKKKDRSKDKKSHKKNKKEQSTSSSKTSIQDSKEKKKKKKKILVSDKNSEVCFQEFSQNLPEMRFQSFELFDHVCDDKKIGKEKSRKSKSSKKAKNSSEKSKDRGISSSDDDNENSSDLTDHNVSSKYSQNEDMQEEDPQSDERSDDSQKENKKDKKKKKDKKSHKEKKEKKEHHRHRSSKKSAHQNDSDDLVLAPEEERQFRPTLRKAPKTPPILIGQADASKRSSILCEEFADFFPPPPKNPPPPPPDSEIPPEIKKKLDKKRIATVLQKPIINKIIQNDIELSNYDNIPPPPAVPPPPPSEIPADLQQAISKKKRPIIPAGNFDLSDIPPPPDTPPPPPPFLPADMLNQSLPLNVPPPPSSSNIFTSNILPNAPAIKPPPPPAPPIPPVFFDPDPFPRLNSKLRYSLNTDDNNRYSIKAGKHRRAGTTNPYEWMDAPEETGNIEDVITTSSNSPTISRSGNPAQSFFLFSSNDLVPKYDDEEEEDESSYSESTESSESNRKSSRRVRMDRFCSYSNKIFEEMHIFSKQEREHEIIELNMLQINERAKKIALKRYKKMLDNYYNEVRGNVDFVEIDTSRDQKVHWRKDPKLIKTNELRVETRILENKIVSIRSENEEARNKMSDLLQIISDKNNELAQIEFEIAKYK